MYQNTSGNYDGPITSVVSPNGYWLAYTWDTSVNPPRITEVTDNAGQTVAYTYDSSGNLKTVTDPDGRVTTYGYDASNRLNSITDARGIQYLSNVYNSSNQVSSQAITGVGTYSYNYMLASLAAAAAPSVSGVVSRYFYPVSRPAPAQAQPGQVSTVQITQPDGTTRDLAFDSNGFLSSDTRAAGSAVAHSISVAMDPTPATQDLPKSASDGDGRTISTLYDSSGNELTNTYTSGGSSMSASATYKGTPFGLPDSITDADGQTWHYQYDGNGDLKSVTDPLSDSATAIYNAQGNQTQMTGPLGDVTSYGYTDGHLTSVTDAMNRVTHYVYDQEGRLVETINPDGTMTSTTYDADNQVLSTTGANGNTTSYKYDQNGNLSQVTDPKSNVTKYGYNNADQLSSVTDALGNTTTYNYYPSGELQYSIDANGNRTDYLYDSLNRLTTVQYGYTGSGSYQSQLTYQYDPATGNVDSVTDTTPGAGSVSYQYDPFDHIKTETGPGGTITYTYNPATGQVQSVTLPGQAAINYLYDNGGRLKTETQGSQQATWNYDADGRVTTETMPGGITADYTYDADSELTEIDYWYGSTFVGNVTYGYDADGRRIAEGGTLVHSLLPAAQSGNQYNTDNELTSFGGKSFTYDNDGNLLSDGTNSYSWNDRGQLASVTTPSGTDTLGYDPLGNLISTSVGGVTTTFAYQKSQLISQSSSNGTSQAFLNGPYGTLASTNTSSSGGGAVQAYLPDALQSTLALVNSSGKVQTSYSYDLFGNVTSSADASDPNPLRYTGLISGSTMPPGLQDNNARDYSPVTGRFISQDPLGMSGSGDNLYAYASGDPVDYSDRSGMEEEQLAACVIGGSFNDLVGVIDGRKNSVGDFFFGALGGCLQGLGLDVAGPGEALDSLEGGELAAEGTNGAEDTTGLGDNLTGDGTGGDGLGENACTAAEANSFPGNTLVTLADGRTAPIDKLKPGDYVKATDPATGKTAAEPVLAIIKGHKDEHFAKLAITITIGTRGAHRTGIVIATTGHSFYDQTRRDWVAAANLRPGDRLDVLGGTPAAVTAIHVYNQPEATAYNITVGTYHDYYVIAADAPILVHNCNEGNINVGGREYGIEELAQLVYQHVGAGNLENRPTYDQILEVLQRSRPERLEGQNSYQYVYKGIRVIINNDVPWRSTAYRIGGTE